MTTWLVIGVVAGLLVLLLVLWKLRAPDGQVRGLPAHWQQYVVCLLLLLVLPAVLPLLSELLVLGRPETKSLLLTTALYAVALAASSENLIYFTVGLVTALIAILFFGFSISLAESGRAFPRVFEWFSWTALGLLFGFAAIERYNRHVVRKQRFIPWHHDDQASGDRNR